MIGKKKKKKLLFASVDIGWRIENYSNFIREHCSEELIAESLVYFFVDNKIYKTNYTYQYNIHDKIAVYRWFRVAFHFTKCLFKYDIFHFFSGETLLTRKLRRYEIAIYKFLGKKVIMHFVGSDIRNPELIYWKQENMHAFLNGEVSFTEKLKWQQKLIQDSKKYADKILVSSPDLISIIPGSQYYPVVLDLNKFFKELNAQETIQKNENEVVILHAPSNPMVKGSKIIHQVLKEIVSESKYNVKMVLTSNPNSSDDQRYNITRYDLFKLYLQADIVIDQMSIGWYGLQSIEALLSQNQVISYIESGLENFLYDDCPIRNANAVTLKKTIYECIERCLNKEVDFAFQRHWVEQYHTIENNHSPLLSAWNINSDRA